MLLTQCSLYHLNVQRSQLFKFPKQGRRNQRGKGVIAFPPCFARSVNSRTSEEIYRGPYSLVNHISIRGWGVRLRPPHCYTPAPEFSDLPTALPKLCRLCYSTEQPRFSREIGSSASFYDDRPSARHPCTMEYSINYAKKSHL